MLTWLMRDCIGVSPRWSLRRIVRRARTIPPVLPRVVATDLDGTLLRSDGTLEGRTLRALQRIEACGALVVLCTARPARWLAPLAPAAGRHGVAVCANGGVIFSVHDEVVLEQFPLATDVAREVVAHLRSALPDGAWAVEQARAFAREPAYTPRWPVPDDSVVDAIDALLAIPPVKLMLRHPHLTVDVLAARARELVGHLVEVTYSSSEDALLEISAAGVSKASALSALCADRGIAAEEVLAFGDMPNDLPMLAWAGRGVAVANAHPDVLAAADEVTAANDEAGVAQVLERMLAAHA
jgi:hydroxymethylpyrimidine pyrophosphatase-like HAD family hydrolase